MALCVYIATLAPDLTWANFGGDGGELITAAMTLGVPHPSGYPTYVLLGKLFSLLPIGTVAYRFNLFSAVCMAAAAAFFTAAVFRMPYPVSRKPTTDHGLRLTAYGFPATAAGLTFAFAPLVWSQAVIAEVYGLHLALLAIFLWSLLGKRPTWQSGIWLGLCVTAHLTSLLFAPLALLLTSRRNWVRLGGGTAVGLLPFLALPILAQGGSPIVWEDPTTITGWWRLISGALYRPNVFAVPWPEVLDRSRAWGTALLTQFTLLGGPLIVLGALHMWRRRLKPVAALILVTTLLVWTYALTYGTEDAIIFLLPSLLLLSFPLAFALRSVGWTALILPLALLLINFNSQNLGAADVVRNEAEHLLQAMPHHAVVLTPGDSTIFTLWYFHHVESVRSDLILVDRNLFAFDWYRRRLRARHPHLDGWAVDDLAQFQQLNMQKRPFCEATLASASNENDIDCRET